VTPPVLGREPRLPEAEAPSQATPNPAKGKGKKKEGEKDTNQKEDATNPKPNSGNKGKGKQTEGVKDTNQIVDATNPKPNGGNKGKENKKSKNKKKQVNFTEHPYAINAKGPATRSYYTLVDKIGNSKPLKDKKLKANILLEIQTFFVEEENFKTPFPRDIKDMDRTHY